MISSKPSTQHSPRSPLPLHLPPPVPWPDQLPFQETRCIVVASYYRVRCTLRCSPELSPWNDLRNPFMITLLTGCALQWVESLWNSNSPVTQIFDAFTTHFKELSGQADSELSVQDRLFRLCQGKSSVWDYFFQFHTLWASRGCHER